MEVKNILQVIPAFGLAGAETMCESLCYELQNSKLYNVYVASLFDYHSPITKRLENRGIKIFYIGKGAGFDIKTIGRLVCIMKKYHIDVVHTHLYVMQYAIPAAIIASVKNRVHTIHNIAEKEVDFLRQKLAAFFYRYCDVIPISISPQIQQSVVALYKISASQTPVVYNGIDLSRCIVKKNYIAHEPFRFVHIGRFSEQKNHGIIIEAAEQLKKQGYKFVINLIGGAGNENERQKEVNAKCLNDIISFKGLQSDIYPFLREADCFILPSLYEGMPVTLIEAMGCGMPIIASAVGGVPDMIKHRKSGLLIEPKCEPLVSAMKEIMNDSKLRENIGKCALEKSNQFSSHNMFEGYNSIYKMKK